MFDQGTVSLQEETPRQVDRGAAPAMQNKKRQEKKRKKKTLPKTSNPHTEGVDFFFLVFCCENTAENPRRRHVTQQILNQERHQTLKKERKNKLL